MGEEGKHRETNGKRKRKGERGREREDGRDDVILSVFPRGDSIAC